MLEKLITGTLTAEQLRLVRTVESLEKSGSAEARQLLETLAKGGQAFRPRIATPTLAAAFVDPALAFLAKQGSMIHLGQRLRRIVFMGGTCTALEFPDATIPLAPEDTLILATPPWVASELVAGIAAPDEFRAIVNVHFRVEAPASLAPMNMRSNTNSGREIGGPAIE